MKKLITLFFVLSVVSVFAHRSGDDVQIETSKLTKSFKEVLLFNRMEFIPMHRIKNVYKNGLYSEPLEKQGLLEKDINKYYWVGLSSRYVNDIVIVVPKYKYRALKAKIKKGQTLYTKFVVHTNVPIFLFRW